MPEEIVCGLFNGLAFLCMKCLLERTLVITQYIAEIFHSLKYISFSNGNSISIHTGAGHSGETQFHARWSWLDPIRLHLVVKISFLLNDHCGAQPPRSAL